MSVSSRFRSGALVVSYLNLPPKPQADTRTAVEQLHRDLSQLGHLEIPRLSRVGEELTSSKTDPLRSTLSLHGPRTVVILDRHGVSLSDNLSAMVAAFGPTTLVSVAGGQHLSAASNVKQHVAIQGGAEALLRHVKRTPLLEGVADVVFGYHSGDSDKRTNFHLARKLLTPTGCYVEIFNDPRCPEEGQLVTYYTSAEVHEIADGFRSRTEKAVEQFLHMAQRIVPSALRNLFASRHKATV